MRGPKGHSVKPGLWVRPSSEERGQEGHDSGTTVSQEGQPQVCEKGIWAGFRPEKRQLVLVLGFLAPEPINEVSEQTSMLVAIPVAFPLRSQGYGEVT